MYQATAAASALCVGFLLKIALRAEIQGFEKSSLEKSKVSSLY